MNADATKSNEQAPIDLSSRGIGLLSSHTDVAKAAEVILRRRFSFVDADEAEVLVALGGDGFMLHTLHEMLDGERRCVPVFGMNRGTVGFLMNEWRIDRLADRIEEAKAIRVAPLEMRATHRRRKDLHPRGDERSLAAEGDAPDREDRDFGQRPRRASGARLRRGPGRDAGGIDRLQSLRARTDPASAGEDAGADPDQSVPARAAGRGRSCQTTPPSACDSRGENRPVSAVADQIEVRDVAKVEIRLDRERSLTLLFDPEHALDERIAMEQFARNALAFGDELRYLAAAPSWAAPR